MTGETIGHYRILRQLGLGGMGEVYLAEDTTLGRQVALKLLPDDSASGERLERFRREARAVASLNHPNIVTLYSVEEHEGRHFLTMEHVEGKTLTDCIPKRGLNVKRVLEIALPLTDALAMAHDKGVIHRDLKPSNVMLTNEGQPKILDFGLAKWRDDESDEPDPTAATELRTQEGTVLGTAPYMSPEQLQGRHLDHRTDIFSLGILLFEMIAGRRPFQGHSSIELASSILRDDPPALHENRQGLPGELSRIVGQCLEKDREERFQDARELKRELQDAGAGFVSQMYATRPVRTVPSLRKPLGIAAAVVLLAAAAFWFLRSSVPEGDRQALALLPFANLTGDPSQDYLGEGLSAGLMTQLAEASNVRVVGRAATWDRNQSPQQIARALGVGSLLDGEVQAEADQLIVDVHLMDVGTGLVLWNQRFTGARDGLMRLQREIAAQLVSVLSISLSQKELDRMARDPTRSFEAYEYFMRGFERLEQVEDVEGADAATTMFEQALRLDPEFALAHAGLSEAVWLRHEFDRSPDSLIRAERAAQSALEVDPALPAAQLALARVLRSRGRSGESIDQLQVALANHPKPDEAYLELAAGYEQVGDLESTLQSLLAAVTLRDDWFTRNVLGMFFARQDRYDDARGEFERAASLAPENVTQPQENLATLDLTEGNFDRAVEAFERIPKPIEQGRLASNIGTAYYYSSHVEKWRRAEEYYRLAVELSPRHDMYRGNLADLYVERGEEELARKSYRIASGLVEEQLETNPENPGLLLRRALYEARGGDCTLAVRHAAELVLRPPNSGRKSYQLAKAFAVCGERGAALDALAQAKELGVPGERMAQDAEFRSLAEDPDFVALIASSAPEPEPASSAPSE